MICKVIVVLPEDSGPKISITRPRGTPPTPSAASKEIEPVEITEMGTIASLLPRRMIEPLPNCFSICANAKSMARERSSAMGDLQWEGTLIQKRAACRGSYTAIAAAGPPAGGYPGRGSTERATGACGRQ